MAEGEKWQFVDDTEACMQETENVFYRTMVVNYNLENQDLYRVDMVITGKAPEGSDLRYRETSTDFEIGSYVGSGVNPISLSMGEEGSTVCVRYESIKNKFSKKKQNEFLDFIEDQDYGLEFLPVIDFTAGDANKYQPNTFSNTLNFGHEGGLINYLIEKIGGLVMNYYQNPVFPVYGFGAAHPKISDSRNGFFPVSGSFDIESDSLAECLRQYQKCLKAVNISGTKNVSGIIKKVLKGIDEFKTEANRKKYKVMLIISDGQIHDIKELTNKIVKSANYPISIIVLGVGGHNFNELERLDDVKCRLVNDKGEKPIRNNIQFINLDKFHSFATVMNTIFNRVSVQFCDWYNVALGSSDTSDYISLFTRLTDSYENWDQLDLNFAVKDLKISGDYDYKDIQLKVYYQDDWVDWTVLKSTVPVGLKRVSAEFEQIISVPFLLDRVQSIRVECIMSNIDLGQVEILATNEIELDRFFGKNNPFSEMLFDKSSGKAKGECVMKYGRPHKKDRRDWGLLDFTESGFNLNFAAAIDTGVDVNLEKDVGDSERPGLVRATAAHKNA